MRERRGQAERESEREGVTRSQGERERVRKRERDLPWTLHIQTTQLYRGISHTN